MKNLNYLMGHILHQIFKIIYFEYILKKHGKKTNKPSIRIYVNKIENRITFKIKTGYYLELLTLETVKLLRSTKIKITKDTNGENNLILGITEAVLVHCNTDNNNYHKIQEFYVHLFLIKCLVNC